MAIYDKIALNLEFKVCNATSIAYRDSYFYIFIFKFKRTENNPFSV